MGSRRKGQRKKEERHAVNSGYWIMDHGDGHQAGFLALGYVWRDCALIRLF